MSDEFQTPDENAVLCYVDGNRAYFTTSPLSEQWGDDWDDAPYEHNAGEPYEPCWHNFPHHRNDPAAKRGLKPGTQTPLAAGELCRCKSCEHDWNEDGTPRYCVRYVFFDGPFETPAERATGGNSAFSVQDINGGQIAWLLPSRYGSWPKDKFQFGIPAGTTYSQFCELIASAGGCVFEPKSTESSPAKGA